MSTITTIQSTDLITNSRADINNNFSALNTDKMETSVLDTDTALTANSDSKIPSQKAVKAYVDAGGNTSASTTAKGIVEEATGAEVAALTTAGATTARLFVNPGSVGNMFSCGSGSDGDVTISSPTTLTRDMYYNNLTVNDVLTVANWRIFVKGTLAGTGTIQNKGSAGGSATALGAGVGAAGAKIPDGYFISQPGSAGAEGGLNNSNGSAGVVGASVVASIGVAGVAGGAGGNDAVTYTGGAAGAAGSLTANIQPFGKLAWLTLSAIDINASMALVKLTSSASSGSGGGGGRNGSGGNGGGDGGGSGSPGGILLIVANVVAGTFTIDVSGGAGGSGGTGASTLMGGGGGGAGGSGGVAILVYGSKTWTGSYTLTGGAGGSGGTSGTGTAGATGSTGTTGLSYEIPTTSLIH